MSPLKIILGTVLLVCGGFILFFVQLRQEQIENPSYNLTTLAFTQTGHDLITKDFFEEVLGLSIEKPLNLLQFSIQDAKEKLLQYPFIENAVLEKILPDTLFIECILRKPVVELADYKQVAIDKEGILFPLQFFYTPKKLPKVFLGLGISPLKFMGKKIQLDQEELKLIFELIKKVPTVKLIDISKINAESLGKREIVLLLPDEQSVRLPYDQWEHSLRYLSKIPPSFKEIDLRCKKLALVK